MRSKKHPSATDDTIEASSNSILDEEASNATSKFSDSILVDSSNSSTKPGFLLPDISITSSLNESKIKRVRTGWTIDQKREIILFCENNSHKYTQKGLADHFSTVFNKRIGRSTINEILKLKSKLFSDEVFCNPHARRLTEPQYSILEGCLVDWANEQVENGVPLTDKMLIQVAKKFGEVKSLGVKTNFKYSNSN